MHDVEIYVMHDIPGESGIECWSEDCIKTAKAKMCIAVDDVLMAAFVCREHRESLLAASVEHHA